MSKRRKTEIRIAGFGGQGVVLAGVVLGRAAVLYDKNKAIQTQSYGAEARGGGARSEVIISDDSIDYPKVRHPDVLVAMSQQALDKYLGDLKPGGLLLIDSELVKNLPPEREFTLYRFPFSRIANDEFGRTIVANVIMLGTLTTLTALVSLEAMKSSIRTSVPKGTEEMNLKALERGMDLAKTS